MMRHVRGLKASRRGISMSWVTRSSIRSLCKRAQSGSAALEFAMVAPVFFFLLAGIMQLGIMTAGQFILQNSVTIAARLVRTGQAQSLDFTQQQLVCANNPGGSSAMFTAVPNGASAQQLWFNQQVCCGASAMLDCTKLHVTVQSVSGFSSGFANYVNSGNPAQPDPSNYNPGTACNVVLVRALYPFPIWFPGLAKLLNGSWTFADTAGGNIHNIAGTAAFRNEPFTSAVNGC
jgi:Flp pilus assembly protein TadG